MPLHFRPYLLFGKPCVLPMGEHILRPMLITDLQMASTKIDRDGFQVEMMQQRSLSMWPQMI